MGIFFNNKEGVGIPKDAPQKKGVARFFELFFLNLSKLLTANILYVLISVPILTYGIGQVGLTYVCRAASRDQHTFPVSDFFETIKKNWKQALPMGIIDIAAYLLMFYNLFWSYQGVKQNTGFAIYFCITIASLIIYTFSSYYRYFMIITFNMKLTKIIKNSFLFVILGVWRNLIISGVLLIFYGIIFAVFCYSNSLALGIAILAHIVFFPAFSSFLQQFCIFGSIKKVMIDPYYKDHPNDDIQFRKQLGLEVPEEEKTEE